MRKAKAFSPAHITGFFQIFDRSNNLLRVGSKGAGVSVSLGVTTSVRVEESSTTRFEISINNEVTDSALVSERVVNRFLAMVERGYNVLVEHTVEVPIGQGFGSSGAGGLSLALALNEVFNLKLSRLEAAQIAHIADAECKTGLGTVIGETFGGLEMRLKPGAPGIGKIRKIPISQDYVVVCLCSRPMSTRRILINEIYRERINEMAGKLLVELTANPAPGKFMTLSRRFAEHIGLISRRLRAVLEETDKAGFTFSMAMLGESIFTIVRRQQVAEIMEVFSERADLRRNVIMTGIDHEGARVL